MDGGTHPSRGLVFWIVTYGQRPDAARVLTERWSEYLDDVRRDGEASVFSYWVELVRGAAAHVGWRLFVSRHVTTLSTGVAVVGAAIASLALMMSGYDDFLSARAEMHSAFGLLAFGLVLVRRPWELNRRLLPLAALLCMTGLLHLAVANNYFVWFDYILAGGLCAVGAGMGYIGFAGLITRTPLGPTRIGLWLILAGTVFIGVGEMLWAFEPTNRSYAVSSAVVATAAIIAGLRILDLWSIQGPVQPTTNSRIRGRLLGQGRTRMRRSDGTGLVRNEKLLLVAVAEISERLGQGVYPYDLTRYWKKNPKSRSLSYSTLYRCFDSLESQGLLESAWNHESGRPRRIYELTPAGHVAVAELSLAADARLSVPEIGGR